MLIFDQNSILLNPTFILQKKNYSNNNLLFETLVNSFEEFLLFYVLINFVNQFHMIHVVFYLNL